MLWVLNVVFDRSKIIALRFADPARLSTSAPLPEDEVRSDFFGLHITLRDALLNGFRQSLSPLIPRSYSLVGTTTDADLKHAKPRGLVDNGI